ncbi:MAG: hypothetical protein H7Y27_16810 [Gemmatimonadaceae bacterium]|nr:hypothetical protein [Chitinophagaceae bacterium]
MKTRVLLLSFLILSFVGYTQQDTCKVGLYINSIYDFDLEEKSYMADFWVWMNFKNGALSFQEAIEVPNAKEVSFSQFSTEKKGDIFWFSMKGKSKIMHEWDVSRFPFDEQHLRIELEDAKYDGTQVTYVADTANSKIDSSFNSKEWQVKSFKVWSDKKVYGTTYGNPELKGSSSYPRLVSELVISRNNSWLMLLKMLTGAYVAFLISCLVFFVSSANQDSRFGLCVGGLFAAIGNKYIVESVIPTTTTNTLMDNVHNVTFMFILLIVGIIIVSLRLFESGDPKKHAKSLKLDKWAFVGVAAAYVLINIFLIFRAAN